MNKRHIVGAKEMKARVSELLRGGDGGTSAGHADRAAVTESMLVFGLVILIALVAFSSMAAKLAEVLRIAAESMP
jgi:hypothetical protein